MIRKILLGLIVVAFAGAAIAQQASIKHTPLQKAEFPGSPKSRPAVAPDVTTHPGVEMG